MNIGILWYDANAKLSAQAKLAQAAARFAERFRRPANCCHVHPSELFVDPTIEVIADPSVPPHHLWVGRDESLVRRRSRKRSA